MYWYFTLHGVLPGSVPKGFDLGYTTYAPKSNGTLGVFFQSMDRAFTKEELEYYDIIDEWISPEGVENLIEEVFNYKHRDQAKVIKKSPLQITLTANRSVHEELDDFMKSIGVSIKDSNTDSTGVYTSTHHAFYNL